jgi:hypothetical protein
MDSLWPQAEEWMSALSHGSLGEPFKQIIVCYISLAAIQTEFGLELESSFGSDTKEIVLSVLSVPIPSFFRTVPLRLSFPQYTNNVTTFGVSIPLSSSLSITYPKILNF